ncbi:MAG TPA: PHP-associated domain-containing protein [Candidatus Nanoarchaeia archaeon]|nr:PHP-associated domain-containing protein [Candidatus Nanoarchaeia archaeon]
MLKADLHLHAGEDKQDRIKYSAKDLIRLAAKKKFDVLSLTFHDVFYYPRDLISFAKNRNILLIPGTELTIHGKHVLIHGIKTMPKIKELQDLEKIKDSIVITAPHPYFPTSTALKEQLITNIKLFDNIEYTARYSNLLNFNKKAEKTALEYKKPLLGNSDCHHFTYFGYTFTNLEANSDVNSVIDALKKGKFKMKTNPLPVKWLLRAGIENSYHEYILKRLFPKK